MSPKKYTNGRKRNDGGNEVLGVGIIIAAAFILLCIVIPPVIGLVSRAVNGIVTGIFGFTSYPIFICLLIYGIALVKNIRPSVPGKYIAAITVAAVCLVMILQLALTADVLDAGFSEYVSYVYDRKNATAGVLFGILAYGMQAGISLIFTYIVLSLGIVACALVLFGVFGKINLKRKTSYKKPSAEPAKARNFEKSGAPAAPVKSVMDTSLFVGNIEPPAAPAYTSESGSYSTMPEPAPKSASLSGYYNEPQYDADPTPYNPPAGGDADKKAEALRILYGDKSSSYGLSGSSSGTSYKSLAESVSSPYALGGLGSYDYGSSTTSYGTPVLQSEPAIRHDAPSKPPKIVHNDLPPIVLPAEKDISDQFVGGEIINGDDLSAQLNRSRKQQSGEPAAPKPYANDYSTGKTEPDTLAPKQPPIMNGDYFGTDKYTIPAAASMPDAPRKTVSAPVVPPKPEPAEEPQRHGFSDALFAPNKNVAAEHGLPPIYTPDSGTAEPPKIIELEPEHKAPAYEPPARKTASAPALEPIASTEPPRREEPEFTSPPVEPEPDFTPPHPEPENSFEALLHDEPSIRERETAPAEESTPTQDGEEKRATSFVMPDEVEDLSEKSFDTGRDYTGYYTKEKSSDFEKRVSEIDSTMRAKKAKVAPNQINLDDYSQSAMEEEPAPKPKRRPHRRYVAPPVDLLVNNSTNPEDYGGDCQEKARILEETLENLKLPAKVSAITKGPAVTRYELEMPPGQSIKRIESFQQDIAYNLASNGKIRIETPIPGKRAVGIEVPNEQIAIVALRDIISSKEFQKANSTLTLALGKDIAGQNIVCPLEKMPHLLIAGATNSGKSACLNSIIMSILYKSSPDDVRLILIDPKEVEFRIYREMPHLLIPEILTDADQASNAFKWAKVEMDRRYKLLGKYCARNITEFNNTQAVKDGTEEKMYSIVIIVDELAELMLSNNHKELEDRMMSVAQKARAAGIHLILATQRPSVNIITGTIKANLPSRIAFAVTSYVDSKTILDEAGAEALLGRGDMLYAPIDKPEPTRVQGAYVTTEEVSTIVGFVKENNEAYFDEDITTEIMSKKDPVVESAPGDDDDDGFDVLMKSVLKRVIESGQASTSMIQRRFSVGYARASRIIDQMESNKFIGPLDGSKPREVYITREQFKEIFGEDIDEVS